MTKKGQQMTKLGHQMAIGATKQLQKDQKQKTKGQQGTTDA